MLSIEQITPHLTWRLRRDVLYPGEYMHNMEMEEDNQGYHFGAFEDNKLMGVVSLFKHADDWQFRKLAVVADGQGKGIGTQIIACVTGFVEREHGTRLWCNARLFATGFYEKLGYIKVGEEFHKNGVDYIIMEKSLHIK
ncbi:MULTISPECIES: GNAT family N-acetyltransferase [unclassified Mucilaginibacter]|uniref:GNAT family N-acetyltransferase n=1 Tax=unclassified Mucilaginibacter TaxID=2617802 RepID=UPI002AC90FC5|nr:MULTISPECIES: GNAT family N-acetyltransferase [unclassified Mucilaginibacter]MEB0263732.1 GNAT family N-acetyltransferase [Mucilaginibacter sp. 10I4]MEB0278008.1 GNAT family N-acetyltransferase [Mucilaginibacter sp. 10B2]MEB0299639.1 GNAT family N-acetyltransferase [Mucilaginibacter sp. 5C4]WPX22897.1 GNAT family N-acetyltransferase [Mucilaginibacter sp. 5C4]